MTVWEVKHHLSDKKRYIQTNLKRARMLEYHYKIANSANVIFYGTATFYKKNSQIFPCPIDIHHFY